MPSIIVLPVRGGGRFWGGGSGDARRTVPARLVQARGLMGRMVHGRRVAREEGRGAVGAEGRGVDGEDVGEHGDASVQRGDHGGARVGAWGRAGVCFW